MNPKGSTGAGLVAAYHPHWVKGELAGNTIPGHSDKQVNACVGGYGFSQHDVVSSSLSQGMVTHSDVSVTDGGNFSVGFGVAPVDVSGDFGLTNQSFEGESQVGTQNFSWQYTNAQGGPANLCPTTGHDAWNQSIQGLSITNWNPSDGNLPN